MSAFRIYFHRPCKMFHIPVTLFNVVEVVFRPHGQRSEPEHLCRVRGSPELLNLGFHNL